MHTIFVLYDLLKLLENNHTFSMTELQQVLDYFDSRIDKQTGLSEISNLLGMSQNHFGRLFKKSIGIPPAQYFMKRRLKKSAYLLSSTNSSLEMIAARTSFANPSQFCKTFQRHIGVTPHQYRTKLLKLETCYLYFIDSFKFTNYNTFIDLSDRLWYRSAAPSTQWYSPDRLVISLNHIKLIDCPLPINNSQFPTNMQILIISNKDSRPEIAITALLAATELTKISTTPTALPSFDLDNIDFAIYIDQRPDFQVIDILQQSRCPSILVADQDFPDNQCLFIPFGILDQSLSVSIGIDIIRNFIDSIAITDSGAIQVDVEADGSPDANIHRRTPAISQLRRARDELSFFESLATG